MTSHEADYCRDLEGLLTVTLNYPAEIERDADGRFVVTFPDFGWGATDGATREEALVEARDLLRELIATEHSRGPGLARSLTRQQAKTAGGSPNAGCGEGGSPS